MLECILEKQNEYALELKNIAFRAKEIVSSLDSLKQKCVFMDTSNDSCVEDMILSGQLIIGSDYALSMVLIISWVIVN